MAQRITARIIRELAAECGFPLAGVARATPVPDFTRFRDWEARGLAGKMHYLRDHRAEIRENPQQLLAGLKSIICVAMPYGGPEPYSIHFSDPERGWIARYAWGADYHANIRDKLSALAVKLLEIQQFSWRACVDTAPLLERSLARQAGLGWIGKNTCLINQAAGSWFLLGELLTTLDLAPDSPAPDRCGTCSRCIDACPTTAIVPSPAGGYELDSRLCISYFTIELRDSIPIPQREKIGGNVFGCDICQDVCPWNRKRGVVDPTADPSVPLERMAALSEEEFRRMFRGTAVSRAKYSGFLRNVAIAMGNSGAEKFRGPLEKLAASGDPLVAEHACWALHRLTQPAPVIIASEQTQ
jgi:epoxyqueuosine reductase